MAGSNPVQNFSGEKLLLLVGNGAAPEQFAASATINTTRALDISVKSSTTEIADAENPSLPATTVRQAISTDIKFTGAGIADAPSYFFLANAALTGAVLDVKITMNLTGAQGGVTFTGRMLITAINMSGTRGDMTTFTSTWEQAAAFTLTQNA